MRPIRPKLTATQITIAEDQHEYLPVTAALVNHPGFPLRPGQQHNAIVVAFRPTDEERAKIAAGADLYLEMLTFGGPITPIILDVGPENMAEWFGCEVER
jgi:hypothetical protein